MDFYKSVSVIGGGSWGTIIAELLSHNAEQVTLYVRKEETVHEINTQHTNSSYIPNFSLSSKIKAVTTLEASAKSSVIFVAIPSSQFRTVIHELGKHIQGHHIVIHCTKGLEYHSFKRMSEIMSEELITKRIGVLSGPNLAMEIAANVPSATVIASRFDEVIEAGISVLASERFRVYGNRDVIGVELGGALKNILAVASGITHGLGFGENAKAMLLTRGIAEMVKLGLQMGAESHTFLGLSGMGDVIATCSSKLSRNFRFGENLSKGKKLNQILSEIKNVCEGVVTTKVVYEHIQTHHIDMPIVDAMYRLIYNDADINDIIKGLMLRPSSREEF